MRSRQPVHASKTKTKTIPSAKSKRSNQLFLTHKAFGKTRSGSCSLRYKGNDAEGWPPPHRYGVGAIFIR